MKPQFDEKDAVLCGVSFDSVADNHAFREKFGFPYALLCDTDKQLGIACGAAADQRAGYPSRITVVIGPDRVVRAVYPQVKPADHPQQVLDAL